MKEQALPLPALPGQYNKLRIETAKAITKCEIAKARAGLGTSGETAAVTLSAFFAAAKAAVDAIVAQA